MKRSGASKALKLYIMQHPLSLFTMLKQGGHWKVSANGAARDGGERFDSVRSRQVRVLRLPFIDLLVSWNSTGRAPWRWAR